MIGCEDRLQNDLYCVEWGVKLYSNQPTVHWYSNSKLVYSMHSVTVFVDVLHSIAFNCVHCGAFWLKSLYLMCLCYLFSAKTAWQTVKRKADFFLQNESIRIDSHNKSNRELECSSRHLANFTKSIFRSPVYWPGPVQQYSMALGRLESDSQWQKCVQNACQHSAVLVSSISCLRWSWPAAVYRPTVLHACVACHVRVIRAFRVLNP